MTNEISRAEDSSEMMRVWVVCSFFPPKNDGNLPHSENKVKAHWPSSLVGSVGAVPEKCFGVLDGRRHIRASPSHVRGI
jgi:hypothetical protein